MTNNAVSHSTTQPTWVLLTLAFTLALSSLSTSITNVALPTLADAFDAPFQIVQWILLANLLTMTTMIVGVGRLGDMIGRRRLLLIGIALFTVSSGLCAVAPNLTLLIAARAVQGLGAATLMALTTAFAGDVFAKDKIGRAMGALGTASAVGTALGPSLGGLLIASFDWHAIFVVKAVLGAAAFVMAQRFLPSEQPREIKVAFDYAGTLTLAMTLAAYALAMTLGRGDVGALNAGLLIAALVAGVAFVRIEKAVKSPLVRLSLFQSPTLNAGVIMSALVMTIAMASMVVGPFYLAGALGLTPVGVGLVLSVGPVVAALMGVPAGRWVDRFGAQRVTVAGLMAATVGTLLLAVVPARLGVTGYVVPLAIFTAGYAVFQAANTTAVMAGAAPDQRGLISGLLNLSRNVGLITGTAFMGAVFAAAAGGANVITAAPDAVARGQGITFLIATGLAVISLLMAMRILRQKPGETESPHSTQFT